MDKSEKYLKEMSDEDNPRFAFQTMSTKLLAQFASGKLNAQEYAKFEMQNRGFDKNGKWIGFPDAEKLWKAKVK